MCERLSLQKNLMHTHSNVYFKTQNIEDQVYIWKKKGSCFLLQRIIAAFSVCHLRLNSSVNPNSAPLSSASASNGASVMGIKSSDIPCVTSKQKVFSLFSTSVYHEVGLAVGYRKEGETMTKVSVRQDFIGNSVSTYQWILPRGHVLPLCESFLRCCHSPGWAGRAEQSPMCRVVRSHPTPRKVVSFVVTQWNCFVMVLIKKSLHTAINVLPS